MRNCGWGLFTTKDPGELHKSGTKEVNAVTTAVKSKPKNAWRDIVRTTQSMGPGRTNDVQKEDWAFALKQIKRREETAKKAK